MTTEYGLEGYCAVAAHKYIKSIPLEALIEPVEHEVCPTECSGPIEQIIRKSIPLIGLTYEISELYCPYSDESLSIGPVETKIRSVI